MKVIGSYCLSSLKKEDHWPFPYFTILDFIILRLLHSLKGVQITKQNIISKKKLQN